MLSSSKVL